MSKRILMTVFGIIIGNSLISISAIRLLMTLWTMTNNSEILLFFIIWLACMCAEGIFWLNWQSLKGDN
ncbi:MAG: hypothetical protein ACRDAO_01645 [Culicoidibacterales bacterium]